jgi:lipid II:glycine glycyltransferase (peptidoglycan interpeptide bridge formation enzyme)
MPLEIRQLDAASHRAFVTERSGSFLQTPAWAAVKTGWAHERLGWYDGDRLVGAGLVLLRQVPRLPRHLAYLPEGPVLDWFAFDPADVTTPLLAHLRPRGVFSVKLGPALVTRSWRAETVKNAIAGGSARRLRDVAPDRTDPQALSVAERLRELGWTRGGADGSGFGDVQPRYVFQVPLTGRSTEDLMTGLNQLWRRNLRKAEKAGVAVTLGGEPDLADFHRLYVETAHRDGFTPRPLDYFQRMWRALTTEDPDRIRLYLAHQGTLLLAATTWVRVGGHVWYSYGASSTSGREHRGSNAVQWRMLRDAAEVGASVYDMRGISDTLDQDAQLFGLIQFKLGTGGQAVEYLGEWDFPLSPFLHRAFALYLARR